jgi:hypothetical protein
VDDAVEVIGSADEADGADVESADAGIEAAGEAAAVFGVSRLLSTERTVFFERSLEVLSEKYAEELSRWVGEAEVVAGAAIEVDNVEGLGVENRDLAVIRPVLGTGFGLLCSDLKLALPVVELLCGGSGSPVSNERPLSRLEVGVYDLILAPLLSLLVDSFDLGGCELGGHASGLSALGDTKGPLLGIPLQIKIGDVEGAIIVGLPAGLLGVFVSDVDRRIAGEVAAVSDSGPCVEIVRAVRPVSVDLVAGFELLRVPATELVGLRVGDVLRTGQSVGRPLIGRVGEQRLFQVRPGARGQRLVAEVTGHIPSGSGPGLPDGLGSGSGDGSRGGR